MDIGENLKKTRLRKRLTLKDLSKRTGLTPSFLSQLERDKVSSSIATLRKIASTLNVKIGYLFEEEAEKLALIKKDKRKEFRCEDSKIKGEILASGFLDIKIEPLLLTIDPGGETGKELSNHYGQEFGIVLEGKIKFILGKKEFIMDNGDSICFDSAEPHKFVNIDKKKAIVLWVITSPDWKKQFF